MILDLVRYNDPMLHKKSEIVDVFDSKLKTLIYDMFKTMYDFGGIGLSAVQIGILKRLFITDVPKNGGKLVFINPVIKDLSTKMSVCEEGCLSIPGITGDVERPDWVVLEYTDIKGNLKSMRAEGLLATCIQHEYDHLEGILFVDRLAPESKLKKVNEYRKLQRL